MTNEIRERVAAITPGQWEYDQFKEKVFSGEVVVCDVGEDWETDADGFFIAAAPDDIRFLLTEVERLQTALAAVSSERDATLAALEPFASVAHRFAVLPDEIQIWTLYPSLRVFHFRDAVRIVRGLEQAARQHDDAAEGSG